MGLEIPLSRILQPIDLRSLVKAGDLVKRCDAFKEWMKQNSWMTLNEEQEIGVIVELTHTEEDIEIIVHWPFTGISFEDFDDLEVINEAR